MVPLTKNAFGNKDISANKLRKSNVIPRLYFANLRTLLSGNVDGT